MTMIKNFLNDETGAVTIDWVALTAGILLLGIAVVFSIFNYGVDPLVDAINTQLDNASAGLCTDLASDTDTGGDGGAIGGQGITSGTCTALSNSQ